MSTMSTTETMNTMELGPVEKYESLVKSNKFVFLVFFRGHWCPFCIAYLKTLQGLTKRIEAEGGKVLVATSEPKNWLPETRKASGYQGEAIVDETHLLATHLRTEGKLDVAISQHKGYEHGMSQPAILVVNTSGEVLEKWAIVPALMNFGGAKDRPELEQVWENVKAKLEGKERVHTTYKLVSFFAAIKGKLFG